MARMCRPVLIVPAHPAKGAEASERGGRSGGASGVTRKGFASTCWMAAWDGYRLPVGFRLILPKRHTGYRSENALLREMVSAFVPPPWAKLVVVGGDAAYGSRANMRMVQERDQADAAHRWGFVFAIARPWKPWTRKPSKTS